MIEAKKMNVAYNDRLFLNTKDCGATSAMVLFDGIDHTYDNKPVRLSFVEISDCHRKVRIHQTHDNTPSEYLDKIKLIYSRLGSYIKHLQQNIDEDAVIKNGNNLISSNGITDDIIKFHLGPTVILSPFTEFPSVTDLPAKYKHNKTGNIYTALEYVFNATNKDDGVIMVVYQSDKDGRKYVRELSEFIVKFSKI